MGIPKQVEDNAAEAEEFLKNLNEASDTEATEEAETDEDSGGSTDESASDEGDTEDVVEDKVDIFEQKYNSLKGKYDAEVPRLHTELKELKESIFEKLNTISETSKEEEKLEIPDDKLAKFKEEYGEDLLGYLDAYFDSKVQPTLKQQTEDVINPIRDKVESVEESQIQSAKTEFADYLDGNVNGDWRDIGVNPKFQEFLTQEDPSGLYTYGELLENYNKQWDNVKMAKVMNIFFGDKTDTKKETKPTPDQDALIAPSRQTKTQVPAADEKIRWTAGSIKQFELDDRKGKYTPEESQSMWNDLLSAPSENRIS